MTIPSTFGDTSTTRTMAPPMISEEAARRPHPNAANTAVSLAPADTLAHGAKPPRWGVPPRRRRGRAGRLTTFMGTRGRPTVPAFAVPRPDLVERLDEALARPTVLLVAPAGYGKSVLLGQWADARPERSVAWVGLSDLDNDAVHLGRHLCDALDGVEPGLASPLRESMHATTDSLGPTFLDQLLDVFRAADGLALVLDDLER